MGIREAIYNEQSKEIERKMKTKELTDIDEFMIQVYEQLKNKKINNIEIEIKINYNNEEI